MSMVNEKKRIDTIKEDLEIVLSILNKYDPYSMALISKNEYDIEAIEIANRAKYMKIDELAIWCKDVFSFWVYPINDDELWMKISNDIKKELK